MLWGVLPFSAKIRGPAHSQRKAPQLPTSLLYNRGASYLLRHYRDSIGGINYSKSEELLESMITVSTSAQ
jgi:hypothetical protein